MLLACAHFSHVPIQRGITALMCAAADNHDSIVDLLVNAGANLNVQTNVRAHAYLPIQATAFFHLTFSDELALLTVAVTCLRSLMATRH